MIFTKILRVPPIFIYLYTIFPYPVREKVIPGPSALDSIVNFLNLTLNINHKL